MDKLHARLVARLPAHEIVVYAHNKRRVDELKQDPTTSWKTKVLIGKESLYTGLNMPRMLGLVVIFRALNYKPSIVDKYTQHVLRTVNYWDQLRYKRTVRQLQAAGRVPRCADDSGVIALLSNTKIDVDHIREHYPGARLTASVAYVVFDP